MEQPTFFATVSIAIKIMSQNLAFSFRSFHSITFQNNVISLLSKIVYSAFNEVHDNGILYPLKVLVFRSQMEGQFKRAKA